MARGLIAALEHAGYKVEIASTLRTRDGAGDPDVQARLIAQAKAAQPAIVAQGRAARWQAWVTYHNYYKAPDLLGPTVSEALGIPYVLIEATRARKRLTGAWADYAARAEAACDAADVIYYLTTRDAEALQRDAPAAQKLIHLNPFLPRGDLPCASSLTGPMLSVGMMRAGDKLASYRLIAETLHAMSAEDWTLHIAGDGAVRPDVQALMAPFEARVRFLGALNEADLETAYRNAALLLWPGVNEAFGMIYLEAQGHGLPVIAQDRPGVRDVLAPGVYPSPEAGPAALARRAQELLADPECLHKASANARDHVAQHHLLPHAAQTLRKGLTGLVRS
ncbi:glycosyltransferase family 4 protein [Sulfitobacter sp. TSTF-M16]|uniref:Glycosyltransferase family 4 protein n=2 Tax=Sulfitobacter aestuariivivens TaxID=2766981 RepID=A0A927D5G1_9RHOB|nr:glycosyltransferase family 4 protein [Sulfitobacter aestuariivivens]